MERKRSDIRTIKRAQLVQICRQLLDDQAHHGQDLTLVQTLELHGEMEDLMNDLGIESWHELSELHPKI